jgi:16S rRNA (cytidine1402-2'-O)-methyltransferase
MRTVPSPERVAGVLVLAATPIGDMADAAPRLAGEIERADVVAAEDTRRLRRLTASLGVRPAGRVVSYHEHNETERTAELLDALLAGDRVVLVTDAGMPAVSDPGYRLVRAAVDAGVRVTAVPGPSAVLTALAVSGLPVDRFAFEGFLPRRAGERSRRLAELASDPRTLVLFEAPHRVGATLAALAESFGGDRPAAVCRELTKTYEEVRRGTLDELVAWAAAGVRGEVTLVVGGADPRSVPASGATTPAGLARLVADAEAAGLVRKEAIASGAAATGVRRRDVYDAVVAARAQGRPRAQDQRSGHGR